ncbi:MAG: HEAT repeat domain-containing protein [Bacteroidales bacterium]|nr:HEAT repeat domain-containing protein [Bacteroidales bacterium]
MKRHIFILSVIAALLLTTSLRSQDIRTVEEGVAGLLARLPADNQDLAGSLMEEMYSLGEEGRSLICSMVVPAGTGDDTKARYAISSLTFHLSGDDKPDRKAEWERQCLASMKKAYHEEVRTFFIRQLNLVGSAVAAEALADFVNDSVSCDDAVIALQFIGGEEAVMIMASGLASDVSPCAAQIMVALADMKYTGAVKDYIRWYEKGSQAERSAALYALASAADPAALPVLTGASENAGYMWEPTGAVQALLLYAKNIGLAGDVKGMEKITGKVMGRSTTSETSAQRLAAMSVTVAVKGKDALPVLLEAADDPDIVIRGGALRLTNSLPGSDVTRKWIGRIDKVHDEAKAEILFMLGERGDALAVPLMLETLGSDSPDLAREAAGALAKLEGAMAVDPLLDWILKSDSEDGHTAAANALITVLDSTSIDRVAGRLPQSAGHSTVTLIRLLAWSGNDEYFTTVMSYVNSTDPGIRATAITSLARLSSYDDQGALMKLLETLADKNEIEEVQRALAAAALQSPDPQKRSDVILASYDNSKIKMRLVPVLAVTGGEAAAKTVFKEFEAGNAETRDVCFDALAHWTDHTALPALYEITASGNKTFSRPAFDAYLRSLNTARLDPERKLQLIKDIAPYALAPDTRSELILLAGTLNTRQAAQYISSFMTDDSEEVRKTAQEALAGIKLPDE